MISMKVITQVGGSNIYFALKRSGNERQGDNPSQNEFNGSVKEIEHFHQNIVKVKQRKELPLKAYTTM